MGKPLSAWRFRVRERLWMGPRTRPKLGNSLNHRNEEEDLFHLRQLSL